MKNSFKILIIEDNYVNLNLLIDCFSEIKDYYFEIEFVNKFYNSIEKIRDNKYDVILIDLILPDVQYSELLYNLKKIILDVPTIIITNNTDKELAVKYVREEFAQDYLLVNEINENCLLRSIIYSLEKFKLIKKIFNYEIKTKALENQLSNVIENISIGIIVVDNKKNILRQNTLAQKIYKNIHDYKNFYNLIEKSTLEEVIYVDSENKYFEITSEKILWDKKDCLIISFKDISKSKKMEKEFVENKKELEQTVAKKINHFEVVNKKLLNEILKRRKVEKQLKQLILRDSKTEQYNRDYFFSFLDKSVIDRKNKYGIIVCYINFFKLINYTFGYKIGNMVLKEVANLIKLSSQGDNNIIAKVGEDEFAILMEETKEEELNKKYRTLQQIFHNCVVTEYKIPIYLNINYVKLNDLHETFYDLFCEAEYGIIHTKFFKDCNNNMNQFVHFLTNKIKEKVNRNDDEDELLTELLTAMLTKLDRYDKSEVKKIINFKDIGFLRISDSIIKKNGLLTEQERKKLYKHPIYGSQIINFMNDLNSINDIILMHHEWWNGCGYPFGLKGDEIPLKSRVLAIVEAYCAMTNQRPYRESLSVFHAINEIKKCSGIQFDPRLVELFLNIHSNLEL